MYKHVVRRKISLSNDARFDLDGVSNCIDDSDEKNCNAEKCQEAKHVYCPQEDKCARKENSKRYY